MTRYTVSPPMLIEKSDKSEPIKGHYYYGQPGEIYFDEWCYNNDTEAYEQHLSSLQQIRMSEDLVRWCEENNKVEIDDSEFTTAVMCPECGGDGKANCQAIVHSERHPMSFFGTVFCVTCDNTLKTSEPCKLCKGKGKLTDAYEFYSNGGYDSPAEWIAYPIGLFAPVEVQDEWQGVMRRDLHVILQSNHLNPIAVIIEYLKANYQIKMK